MLYYIVNLASLKVLETYTNVAETFKKINKGCCSASQAIMHLHWFKRNPTIKYLSFLWLQLRKPFAFDNISCLFKVCEHGNSLCVY